MKTKVVFFTADENLLWKILNFGFPLVYGLRYLYVLLHVFDPATSCVQVHDPTDASH